MLKDLRHRTFRGQSWTDHPQQFSLWALQPGFCAL